MGRSFSYEYLFFFNQKFLFPKWIPEITHHCPNVPFLVVGTQTDLRKDEVMIEKLRKNKHRPTSTADGERLQSETKAIKYVECSSLTQVWQCY